MDSAESRRGQSEKTPSYRKALSIVFVGFLLVVFGIPFGLALTYLFSGMNSVSTYTPPIGQVMQFYYNAATLLATVSAAPAVIIAALLALPKFRKFAFAAFERAPSKETLRAETAPSPTKHSAVVPTSTVVTRTSNYVATLNDDIIQVDSSQRQVTITLPPATNTGKRYEIYRIKGGNDVIIQPSGNDKVMRSHLPNGMSHAMLTIYGGIILTADGVDGWIGSFVAY